MQLVVEKAATSLAQTVQPTSMVRLPVLQEKDQCEAPAGTDPKDEFPWGWQALTQPAAVQLALLNRHM